MLTKNKFSKYLLYAVGEILLVVIGILIALQINNWNEDVKNKKEELSVLKEIKLELIVASGAISSSLHSNKDKVNQIKLIAHYFHNDLPYSEVLNSAFYNLKYWDNPYLSRAAYEGLAVKGIDLIQNDSLKREIVNLYDNHFTFLAEDYNQEEWTYMQSVSNRLITKYLRKELNESEKSQPNDYDNLKQNIEFLNMVHELADIRQFGVKKYEEIILEIDHTVNFIDKIINTHSYQD